ncbi:MAG: MFS transporter [Defluviicoccus sp.]
MVSTARAQFAWCSLDWANSAFPTVIITFVFAAYFAKAVAADAIAGTAAWSYTISLSMAAVALTGPLLGAIADAAGRRKPWVLGFSLVCIAATALLWFAVPQSTIVIAVLVLVAIANYGFETSIIFYNAMLPSVASPERIGRISGWGWALGYFGGLVCLVFCLLLLVQPDPPLFGLDRAEAEPVRATALFVAGWYLVFLLPFMVLVPDRAATGVGLVTAAKQGLHTLAATVRHLRRYRQVGLYLLAHMVYTDGLNTLFGIGGIYAAVTFGMDFNEILVFGIALNVAAGSGAFAFGWVDDRIGPKRTLIIALIAMIAIGAGLIVVTDVTWFWVLALGLSLFFGPAQSASRTLMARLAPPNLEAEMFGLYALSGKATAFLGPALFGWVTALAQSQRVGLATILVLFIAGLGLLVPVREPDLPANGGSGASA